MSIRTWDYHCTHCDTLLSDVVITSARMPATVSCSRCGRDAGWASQRGNHLHTTHSGMYGRWDHGLDCVVESYDHKKRLMKQMGVQEASDASGGNRKRSEEIKHRAQQPRPKQKIQWTDTLPE